MFTTASHDKSQRTEIVRVSSLTRSPKRPYIRILGLAGNDDDGDNCVRMAPWWWWQRIKYSCLFSFFLWARELDERGPSSLTSTQAHIKLIRYAVHVPDDDDDDEDNDSIGPANVHRAIANSCQVGRTGAHTHTHKKLFNSMLHWARRQKKHKDFAQ